MRDETPNSRLNDRDGSENNYTTTSSTGPEADSNEVESSSGSFPNCQSEVVTNCA